MTANSNESKDDDGDIVTTLIFDVDDTLYDVGCGFSDHRNFEGAPNFMVECLGLKDFETALKVRNEYFARYHSTAKALSIAQQDGVFTAKYSPDDFDEYITTKLNFDMLGGKKVRLLKDLQACELKMVAFSNGPRKYVKRILEELGLWELFGEDRLFAVNDLLPACKPEREAFDKLFEAVGVAAGECVMVEDSMKNVRRAKELGLKTVMVVGAGRMAAADRNGAGDRYDAPILDDPTVDVAIETIEELRDVLPGLWESPARFAPPRQKQQIP